jgi:[acyl-carrier-protein] S-malonyltransferase
MSGSPISVPIAIRILLSIKLLRQLNQPLLWEDSIKVIIEKGMNTFIEVGPKTILSGLIRRIDREIKLLNVEDTKTLEETLNVLSG